MPSYRTPLASTISGLNAHNFSSLNGSHHVNQHPTQSQDASVTIEQTWLLEDAVRKGQLNKSNALKEEVMVSPAKESRLQLPYILRRRKADVKTTEKTMETEWKAKLESAEGAAVLSPSTVNTCPAVKELGAHTDVFKKVKLPDIHKTETPQRDELKLAGSKKTGLSKEEKRARKKERLEKKERERKEKKEKKTQNRKKSKRRNDSRNGARGKEQNGKENSSTTAEVPNPQQDQKDGDKKENEPTASVKGSEEHVVSKDDECPKVAVGKDQIDGEIEVRR